MPTTRPSSTTSERSAVRVRTVALPVPMSASSDRAVSACPPTITSPGSMPHRSVHNGRRTSGSSSPSTSRGSSEGKIVRPRGRKPGLPGK